MTQHGKKYKESLTKADRESMHGVVEAVELVKGLASAKFDETVELAVRLGVDPRKADQIVRGTSLLLRLMFLIHQMKADVAFNDLGHQCVHRTAAGRDIVKHGGAFRFVIQFAFDGFHLAADAPHAVQ